MPGRPNEPRVQLLLSPSEKVVLFPMLILEHEKYTDIFPIRVILTLSTAVHVLGNVGGNRIARGEHANPTQGSRSWN